MQVVHKYFSLPGQQAFGERTRVGYAARTFSECSVAETLTKVRTAYPTVGRIPGYRSYSKETLNKSFDKLRTNGKLLIPFMVYSALVVELVEP
jgi:hypothetical protein